jgi:2',3'-cyclic-nucleotide 2'-phosphodiesterase (5'-nucleotidase family)
VRPVVGFILALVVCAGCAAAPCERRPPARLQLLSVNDVYRLDPDAEGRGGLARVATLVRGLRRENPDTIFALAGDTISPSILSSILRGRHMIEAWNAIGLDAATFGNHEFDFGPDVLRERMGESRFLWISANVFELPGGRPFGRARRWLRRDVGGLRVGMIGLTTPETARTSNGGQTVQFEGVEGAAGFCGHGTRRRAGGADASAIAPGPSARAVDAAPRDSGRP